MQALLERVSFLFTGPRPIQTGIVPGILTEQRAALVRGRVIDRSGAGVAGVAVEVHGRPELGGTRTRDDGAYDLVVNGGGELTLTFERAGYVRSSRSAAVRWGESLVMPDLVLVQLDPVVTTIALGSADSQVAAGSLVEDADGARTTRVIFPPGTTAELELPSGERVGVPTLSVRVTE
ncbi:MAG: carboxypeptidase regulatory-like domain-containing protein, partial [Deltaproteobacteria bacterium]|nr:carboxypeptidase regulatory-like domain-containing protein [Deltaproteobacteria bacterium]